MLFRRHRKRARKDKLRLWPVQSRRTVYKLAGIGQIAEIFLLREGG
jgi:hypothetical protein